MDNQSWDYFYESCLTNLTRYLDILRGTVTQFLREFSRDERRNYWFLLDGATAHSARNIVNWQKFIKIGGTVQLIRGGGLQVGLTSDLTLLEFLRDFIKYKVYFSLLNNLVELVNRVRTTFGQLDNDRICTSINTVRMRIYMCQKETKQIAHTTHIINQFTV